MVIKNFFIIFFFVIHKFIEKSLNYTFTSAKKSLFYTHNNKTKNEKVIEIMKLYSSVVSTVNKIFTKTNGRHWYAEDTFDKVFFGGHYGDGKFRINKNYRHNCIVKALFKIEELDNVQKISTEEAKKYIPAVIAEYENFRNEQVEKYFGTWENLEKHWAKVEEEIDEYYANIEWKCTEYEICKKF